MIHQLVEWMDSHFGHDLTGIVVSTTLIGRGVDAVFNLPRFRGLSELKGPIKLVLQTGFAREYQHATWTGILQNRAYSHVVGQFSGTALADLPEAKAAIVAALNHVQAELDAGE